MTDIPGNLLILLGNLPVTVSTTMRLHITSTGSGYSEKIELCQLATPSPTLAVTYTPAVLATMNATAPFSATPTIGGPIALPAQSIRTGSNTLCHPEDSRCAQEDFVDSDNDGLPGVTLPASITALSPPLDLDAYVALTIPVTLSNGILTDATHISGDGAFAAIGQFHSTSSLPSNGAIDLTTTNPTFPVTLTRLGAGDIPCSTVVQPLP
ncbi:MAG TPA: hypothetical protein VI072_14685 [Polyangiaceae bacterium]